MIRIVSMGVAVALVIACNGTARSQEDVSAGLAGRWEGTLGSGLRLVLEIARTEDGLHFGTATSVDQGNARIPIDRITVDGDSIRLEFGAVGATYVGRLSADGRRLTGIFTQRGSVPLQFERAPAVQPAAPSAGVSALFGVPATLRVPTPPTPFFAAGKRHLVYEIEIENHGEVGMLLRRLEISNGDRLLESWEGADLHAILTQRRPGVIDNRSIPAGGWAVAFAWVAIDSATAPPATLDHRFTVGDETVQGTVAVAADAPIVLGPPLRGGDWLAANGPGNSASHHRRAVIPIDGEAYLAQRFATDWARLGPDGRLFDGDPRANASYHGYGADVIAVADAVVIAVTDSIPENVPGQPPLGSAAEADTLRAVPITIETVAGNSVILDLGGGRYASYGHLIPGSLRVEPGDRVRRGDVLARLGNSGNSTAPHLHFQVTDGPRTLAAEGMPYHIGAWESMDPGGSWQRRADELPLLDARVRFPER